jgi:hypothetical protein
MSDQTLEAINDAIQAHLNDESDEGDYLTEWVLVTATALPHDAYRSNYFRISTSMPRHHSVGLLTWGLESLSDEDEE